MASNHTQQYGLCQWEATDQVLRTDFNADNQKIEAALIRANTPWFQVGVLSNYDGSKNVTVNLGRQPCLVIVGNQLGFTNFCTSSSATSAPGHTAALPGYPGYLSDLAAEPGRQVALTVTSQGFTLNAGLMSELAPYYYLAFFESEDNT